MKAALARLIAFVGQCFAARQARSLEHRLVGAVSLGRIDRVSSLLALGQWEIDRPLSPPSPIPYKDSPRPHQNFTLLHVAAKVGQVEMVEYLLNAGANPNIKTNWHISPMHLAARGGNLLAVAALAQWGGQLLDRFPSLSTFCEDDPYTPTSLEILATKGITYDEQVYRNYCTERDRAAIARHTPIKAAPIPRISRL